MSFSLIGFGRAVPTGKFSQEEARQIAQVLCCRCPEDLTWLPSMYQQTGIDTRYTVLGRAVVQDILDGTSHSQSVFLPKPLPDDPGPTTQERMKIYAETAPPLAIESSQRALQQSGLSVESITHLVTASCTGFFAPGVEFKLMDALQLRPDIQRTHLGFMGCHAALNALRVANAYASAAIDAKVLVCCVELSSLHYHYGWDPQRIVANALFADGAGAMVGIGQPQADCWKLQASGSCVLPQSANAMTWTIGDHGFEMTLSKKIPGLIATHLRPWLESWLGQHGRTLSEIRSWAIHPGGPKILTAVQETLQLSHAATEVSREVLAEVGNISSATIIWILDRLIQRQAPTPTVALAFGPGLVVEAGLFE